MSGSNERKLIIIAIGGNSLIIDDAHRTVQDQYAAIVKTAEHIAGLVQQGHRVLVTHGNGPQVGFVLRRSDLSRHELHAVPLDSCVADTQGAIGYQLQQAIDSVTSGWPNRPEVATVITRVLVDGDDPSFTAPSKPIGSFMDEATAKERQKDDGWDVVNDAGRGWRRVVPSPRPREILELRSIQTLLEAGAVVVAVGGGGIPVVRDEEGRLSGVAAVIDKDLATSLAARKLGADVLVISTAVERVCLRFGKPDQVALDRVTVEELKRYMAEGHFAPGSMRPKIEAVVDFLETGGREALITDPEHLVAAFEGRAGTWVVQ